MTPNKGQDSASARCGRAKYDDAVIAVRRIRPYVCDAGVQGKKSAFLAPDAFEKNLVRRAGQSLVRHQLRIVAHCAKVITNLSGEVLIDLEFHVA